MSKTEEREEETFRKEDGKERVGEKRGEREEERERGRRKRRSIKDLVSSMSLSFGLDNSWVWGQFCVTECSATDIVLYPLDTSSHPQPPAVTARKVSRALECPSIPEEDHPWSRTSHLH